VHTLICRGSGLPLQFSVSPATIHDSPFARPLLERAISLYHIRPYIIRLDAAYWRLRLITWIYKTICVVAAIHLPPQAPEKPLLLASYLEQEGIWKTE